MSTAVRVNSLWLVLCVAFGTSALAAEPVTWDDTLRLALGNNPDYLAADRSVQARRAQLNVSYNGLMPQVGLSSGYTDSMGHPRDGRWQASASASLEVFNQSEIAGIKTARAALNQSEANLKLVSSNVVFDLRQSFANLLFAQLAVDVSRRVRDIRERDSELVTLRYRSGRESKGNMMRATAEMLQADSDLAQSQRDVTAAQQALTQQTGVGEFQAFHATGTLTAETVVPHPDSWTPYVDVHPNVFLQNAALETAQASLRQSQGVLWPTVSASYNRSFRGTYYFPDDPNWTATGSVNLPIFGGGPTAAYYGVTASRRTLEAAQQELRSTRNQVRSDLESTWSALASAQEQVGVQAALLDAARQRNGEADVRYASGLMSYENWAAVVTERVTLERGLIRAQRDAVVAEAQWKRTLGRGLGDYQ